ncbi:hypothetical protein NKH71_00415 [Mesorhizobium sp. M0983]|uniref:hypothetical protein n=1 Tax=Mesorhizobium sp. M0983 TaxID=2957040 RepID=UPI00333B8CC5
MNINVKPPVGGQVDWLIVWVSLLSVCFWAFVGGELFCRYYLGLGTPPLSVAHPTIEYMWAPNQDVYRFGNHIVINELGMRSAHFPITKPSGEFRALVVGDSVINGGALTDQADLATNILSVDGALYLNASAGSWGPENEEAYINRFGTFNADMLILVLSTHDAGDVPTFAALNPKTHPTVTPWFALSDAAFRYFPRYLRWKEKDPKEIEIPPARSALAAITRMMHLKLPVCVITHATMMENKSGVRGQGYEANLAAASGVPIIDDAQFISAETGYQDMIHLNKVGQIGLSQAMAKCRAVVFPKTAPL